MSDTPIWRTVKHGATHYNPGYEKHWAVGGSVTLILVECGHELRRKLSAKVPKRSRCRECENIRDYGKATVSTRGKIETTEYWDKENNLPIRVERILK